MLNYTNKLFVEDNDTFYCPARWDKLLCWPPTAAGTVATQSCPKLFMFDSRRSAFKECWSNGTWYHHPESGKEWSNYTDCVDFEDLKVSKY